MANIHSKDPSMHLYASSYDTKVYCTIPRDADFDEAIEAFAGMLTILGYSGDALQRYIQEKAEDIIFEQQQEWKDGFAKNEEDGFVPSEDFSEKKTLSMDVSNI